VSEASSFGSPSRWTLRTFANEHATRGGVQTGLSEDASSVVESRGATVEAVRPPRVPV
jgi:hypothetical protein